MRCRLVSVVVLGALGWMTAVAPGLGKRLVIGRSVLGRPIVAWSFGPDRARRKVLVVGCIHGNECAGLSITSKLRATRVPKGVQLWLVPEMNPDGTAADTRQNGHGVDLNRNFPYQWQSISDPTYYSGPRPHPNPRPGPRCDWCDGSNRPSRSGITSTWISLIWPVATAESPVIRTAHWPQSDVPHIPLGRGDGVV